mmetsp:Transcript_50644/g.84231  ORF Transcript_50644/g.84231 Transcript_50644/m.84231 type:complete len:284 (-) Transcript_50644:296-1147(-)
MPTDMYFMYQPVVTSLLPNVTSEDVDYYFGIGNQGIESDLVGIISTWLFYYAMMHFMFYGLGSVMRWYVTIVWPKAGTNHVSRDMTVDHIKTSEYAFPLYTCVPVIGDFLRKKGLTVTCSSLEECGGIAQSSINFGLFLIFLELIVFIDHYYLLHVWKWGKKHLRHDVHHRYEASHEMTTFTGFAFDAVDGFSQGFGLVLCQLFIPVPCYFVWALSLLIGAWTMYIHQGVPTLPYPMMGADYHFVHHKFNWYNFGFFTVFWDWVFGTLKHPTKDDHWMYKEKK